MNFTKRIIPILLAVTLIVSLCACSSAASTKNTVKEIGTSEKFSDKEIDRAVKLVLKDASKMQGVKSVDKIRYDEKKSTEYAASYHATESDTDNAIVFFVDFTTGDDTNSLNPNDTYTNYAWILKRSSKGGMWQVIDCGY